MAPECSPMELGSETRLWLQAWHEGDRSGLDRLLERDLDWIRARITARMGPLLKGLADVDDFVQDAVVEVLGYGPRFLVSDQGQFRALVARIAENVLRDRLRKAQAGRRDVGRQKELPSDSMLVLDPPVDGAVTRPSMAAAKAHDRAWVNLAIELLPSEDRNLVRMRDWDGRSFGEIGQELGMGEDAVRMRYRRLLPTLARNIRALREGRLPDLLANGGGAG